jgi:HAD superfamily hydrolase (TIGR01509 family)
MASDGLRSVALFPESEFFMPIKAVLFDIDGTLVDSNDQHVTVWDEVFRDEGQTFDRQVIHDQIGKDADMLVPTLMPGMDENTHERLGDAHGEIFKARFLDAVQPFAKAHELLARVHVAGQKVVLASSASKAELDHYLDLLNARDMVAATTSADDVGNTKPAPDIFSTALGKLDGCTPDDVIVVGDTPYDIEAASKCGIATIALRSGKFNDEALREAGALCLYDDVAALLADYDRSPLAR